jgi:ADP-heptose:LPS heptosyltransferase
MHLAAAAGTRVLAIFGPTSEIRFSPLGANCRVISLHYECSPDRLGTYKDRCETCRFSEPRCLTELPVGTVFDEVRNLLEQYSAIQGVSRTN